MLTETSPQCLARTPSALPAILRGISKLRFQWDQSKIASNLGLSEECTVVESFLDLQRLVAQCEPRLRAWWACEWIL